MKRFITTLALASSALSAQALQITSFSPQSEVSQVRQIVVKMDAAAVTFGDPKAPAPVMLNCSDTLAAKGTGRWTSEREWVFDFEESLPPGVRCTATLKKDFKSPSGTVLKGTENYQFNTGGPFVRRLQPGSWSPIDEEQFFVLELNGPATLESVRANVWCALADVGERVPVRLVEGQERTAMLKHLGLDKRSAKQPLQWATLTCNRRLTAGTKMQLVFGKGVATPSGIANNIEKRFDFEVRKPFEAEFTCERTSADAPCLPVRPMMLSFNAPVAVKLASAIRLQSAQGSFKPELEKNTPADGNVTHLQFVTPLPANTSFTVVLPKDFQDISGRSLRNAANFPLKVATGDLPPLAKFAASPFGIVERYAEGPDSAALLPVTLRNVEAGLSVQGLQAGVTGATGSAPGGKVEVKGKVSTLQPTQDADIIAWYRKVRRYDETSIERTELAKEFKGAIPPAVGDDEYQRNYVQTRMLSLLAGRSDVKALDLPKPVRNDPRPFEVVGIPLTPGFHVVEIASQLLGGALLDERYGANRTMYVRTTALVTNLGVHFKLGRENALVWVTTLDKGQPVAGAQVRVSGCDGKELATAKTNAQGIANIEGLSFEPYSCEGGEGYFVSARAKAADGSADMAFTWSNWQRGIEPWRFNLPTAGWGATWPVQRAHTIFDRTLLRAGETVSMKHIMRTETLRGFALPADRPKTVQITHIGSGQQFEIPLDWRTTATGGLSAQHTFTVPPAAKLGAYSVALTDGGSDSTLSTGQFRVEEFRLPVLQGRVGPADAKPLVRQRSVPTQVQINYVAGGAAAGLPVRVSALVRSKALQFSDYDDFQFSAPRQRNESDTAGDDEEATASQDNRVVADKLPIALDRNGLGKLNVDNLPLARKPQDLVLEATYADPNGEVQTLRSTHTLWPAGVVAGIKAQDWVSAQDKTAFQALALQHDGKPAANVSLKVQAIARITTSSRKRMVGGFYSYDNQTTTKDLGTVCSGKSDARGLLLCNARIDEPGQVELVVVASDKDGNTSEAAASIWVTRKGEMWFGGEDHDRIDLLPEKKSYQPGETAKFQVRMPFRFATALVTIEREGIIDSQVVQLNGKDPTLSLKVQDGWGPNVYVSALALRGRLRDVPWYSFFTWGYKEPGDWWQAFWYEGKEYVAPTAMVDLAKPAYRLGVTEIRVGTQAHQINVKVTADKESYPVRGKAQVTISATLPNGKPAAHAEVAVAAVDQALLELMPNSSWNLLDAMLQRRNWNVETSTAQMEIIGRRHYGRKAVPAGGGGGRSSTRELLDTLLLWEPALKLDANGQAKITVPLNDALTTFKIVAVADASLGLFGTGSTSVRATQDLQIISGLPPLVREGDEFRAQITLRNTTAKAMKVEVSPRATLIDIKPQTIDLPAGEAREVAWTVKAPEPLASTRTEAVLWEIDAKDTISGARDGLKTRQRIVPAVPLTVQQATLVQVDANYTLPVAPPADALPGRGGLKMSLQPKLAEGLPGVRDWWAQYPFSCLEQKTSKAVGMRDKALWKTVTDQLPTYLDSQGLAYYFPPREGDVDRGSDTLTAYVLAAAHEAASLDPAFALPDEARSAMLNGLVAFVEGRIQRDFWSPRKDLDMRKLAAIEALSRYGAAQPAMLNSITIAPNQWPTHAVIDWLMVLQRMQNIPERNQRMAEASQIVRSRLSYQGTKLIFSTERDDYWWWLMHNGDTNTARLILAVINDPAWKDDMGRLANGFILRQQGGAWHTTTANLWGGLALEKFSAKFEATPVTGQTKARMGEAAASVDWAKVERIKTTDASGAAHQTTMFGAPASPGNLRGNSMFLPWGKPGTQQDLNVTHQGTGKPWLTVQSVAAVALKAPFAAGYSIKKTITPVEQANPQLPAGQYTRGDVLRIKLEVNATADMTWVAITDPVPAGATILGSGLGRDSEIATQGEKQGGAGWLAFEERSFEAFRSYYQYLPKGSVTMEYTVRLNNAGDFALPPSRVEAMYAPEMFGETPNARVKVGLPK